MSHELTRVGNTQVHEMAYVGDTPWHGLGQQLEEGATIEQWQEAAHMNWVIRRVPLWYTPDRAMAEAPRKVREKCLLVRSDNGNDLGIVSERYQIVQPGEVLEFFRDLVATEGFQLETAGTMFGGARYWALAKVTKAKLCGWDEIGGYVLLSSTADGTRATEVRPTTVRVVCNNTLSMALSMIDQKKQVIKINHRTAFDIKAIHEKMGLTEEHFAKFVEVADVLTRVKVSQAAAEAFLHRVLRRSDTRIVTVEDAQDDADSDDLHSTRAPKGFDTIMDLFQGAGRGSLKKGSEGTAWGLVNAVTEYVDYYSQAKTQDHRFERSQFSSGSEIKTDAFATALTFFS